MRLALDVSKIAARDGIGSWTRGVLFGLAAQSATPSDIERVLLYDLEGGLSEETLGRELSLLGAPEASSDLFESRIGLRPIQDSRPIHEAEGTSADIFLAPTWRIPSGWTRPLVFVVHDLTVLTHPWCHTVDNRIHTLEGCLRALVNDAAFLAVSEATTIELERHFDLPRSRVAVVHNGLDSRYSPLPAGDASAQARLLRDRFGLAPGYVLAVGSLEPRKNLERLISAHAGLPDGLRKERPLVVVGGGGWRNESLEEALRAAGARGDVHRLGRVAGSDLLHLYRGASLFAYPSLAEGFGLPLLEAMACGTPVLTSDRSSMPEVAGDAARLVDPENVDAICEALEQLLTNPAELTELSQNGIERAKSFSWTRAAGEIVDLCRQLLTSHPSKPPGTTPTGDRA